jgi:hypothetical protein
MDNDSGKPLGPTMSVPDAGRYYFGLGKNASYAAAKRGDIPTVRLGPKTLRALTAPLNRMVGNPEPDEAA